MKDLIEALTILCKYDNPQFPTHCEHDVLLVNVDPSRVTSEDLRRLDQLGFVADDRSMCFRSHRYGSC